MVGNIITNMGPPGDTPSKSKSKLQGLNKLKKGNKVSNYINNSGYSNADFLHNTQHGVALESPFGSVLLNSAGFPVTDSHFPLSCTADTPAKLMQFDPPLSKPLHDVNGFDFDEIVSHFPSPRPGDSLGASPHRWSGESTGSVGSNIFTFPESVVSGGRSSNSGEKAKNPTAAYSTRSNSSVKSTSNDNMLLSTSSASSGGDNSLAAFEAPLSTSSTISFANNLSSTVSWGGGYSGNFDDAPLSLSSDGSLLSVTNASSSISSNNGSTSTTSASTTTNGGKGFGPKRKKGGITFGTDSDSKTDNAVTDTSTTNSNSV